MSFSFSFACFAAQGAELVDAESAPLEVKSYIKQALGAFAADQLVDITASGHLWGNERDLQTSTANISVKPVIVRQPKRA